MQNQDVGLPVNVKDNKELITINKTVHIPRVHMNLLFISKIMEKWYGLQNTGYLGYKGRNRARIPKQDNAAALRYLHFFTKSASRNKVLSVYVGRVSLDRSPESSGNICGGREVRFGKRIREKRWGEDYGTPFRARRYKTKL